MKSPQEYFSKDYFFGRRRSNYFNYNWWDNDSYWNSIITAIKKYKINGKMLDIGCAFGFLLKRVAPYFNEIHGIDISDYAIQRAKKEAPTAKLKVININRGKLPYPDKYFDLIAAIDVLEHTESIEKSLRKIKRILRHNGYLIISVPLKDTLAGKIHNILNRDLSHFCILSRKELFDIIDRVGFKVLEKSYFFNMIFFKLKGIPVFIEVILQKK